MKNIFATIALCIITLAACNCSTQDLTQKANRSLGAESLPALGIRATERQFNKALLDHISDRTAFITVDCSPKEGVVILGVKDPERIGDGWGSGIIVRSRDGESYIFTAEHVVGFSDASQAQHFDCDIYVQRSEDIGKSVNKHSAVVIAKNANRDIAVLRVETNLGVNTVLATNKILGEDVWAAGVPIQKLYPKAKRLSITRGVLATLNVPPSANTQKYGYYDRVSSQVYFGNSGGGIWNQEGELMSIVNLLIAGAGRDKIPYEGYYYVKPIKEILLMLSLQSKYQEVFKNR